MALRGIRVIEIAGLAPVPFCGMILKDFGADVIRVDRVRTSADSLGGGDADRLCRGKRSIALDLKHSDGVAVFKQLISSADVLVEPFRPGVMERLGLGPAVLMATNPRLVFARLSGYGQSGAKRLAAGHDINYLAQSGVLGTLGRDPEPPTAPVNYLGDFAAGSLVCAFGVLAALLERSTSGRGQVVDAAISDGAAYLASFRWASRAMFGQARGQNLLDGGAPFYAVYETSDGGHVAVGALEPAFYANLLTGLGLSHESCCANQMDADAWPAMKAAFAARFAAEPRAHWEATFDRLDACVSPVLTPDEAPSHRHNRDRATFFGQPGAEEPSPQPQLSRTPAEPVSNRPRSGQHTLPILRDLGIPSSQIAELIQSGAVAALDAKL